MKSSIWSAAAVAMMAVAGASGSAQAGQKCANDVDCPCGDVCSYANPAAHVCIAEPTADPGWCGVNTDCLYVGQTCKLNACTPAWTDMSVCDAATDGGLTRDGGTTSNDGGMSEDDGGTTTDGGGVVDGGETTDGGTTTDGGGVVDGGETTDGGTTTDGGGMVDGGETTGTTGTSSGTTTSGTTGTSSGATGGASTGTTGGSTGGTTGGTVGPSCAFDFDCQCGQVCSWLNIGSCQPPASCGNCVDASGGDPGWCGMNGAPNECLYEGQMCTFPQCFPAWSTSSVCLKGATTGGSTSGGNGGGTGGGSGATGEATGGSTGGNPGGTGNIGGTSGTTGTSGYVLPERSSCSSPGGSFGLIAAVFAIGLLSRRRKQVV